MVSAAELRFLKNKHAYSFARVADLYAAVPAINGKIELVYEGEQEGPAIVAQNLIGLAIRNTFLQFFPDPGKLKKKKEPSEYSGIIDWFAEHNMLDLMDSENDKVYSSALIVVDGLEELVRKYHPNAKGADKFVMMEFALHGLAEHSLLSKSKLTQGVSFKDLFSSLLNRG
jgi:magnesium chelatase subunit I